MVAHQAPHVVISWHAVDRQPEATEQGLAVPIGGRCIVLDNVTSERNEIGIPAGLVIMIQNSAKRGESNGAAQGLVPVGEQVRVRQVQDPDSVDRILNFSEPQAVSKTWMIAAAQASGQSGPAQYR